jgi:Tol biopolymer transport system component
VLTIAPDGQHFVYNGDDGLYLRALDTVADRRIPGTEGSLTSPALSPDGQSVVYFDFPGTQLKRIAVSGGASLPLTDATNPFGISWEADGTILYGQPDGIWQVSENGDDPQHLITTEAGEQAHGPQRLPGGDWILFTLARTSGSARWDEAEIVVASPATGERRVVLTGGSDARYLPTGHVVYAFEDVLYAVAFDVDRLERRGGQVPVVQGVQRAAAPNVNTGAANFSVTADGTLVYVPGAGSGTSLGSLVLLDRTGTATPVPAAPRDYFGPRVSPDGTRIAVEETEGTSTHIAIVTVATGVAVRLTFEGTRNWYPVWTPDSQTVIFASNRGDGEGEGIYRKAADGTGEAELVFEDEGPLVPTDVSRDGVLAFLRQGEGASDIWTLPLDEGGAPSVFLATPANEIAAEFSPDGRWIAYTSTDGSLFKVYARPYPRTTGDLQLISEGTGTANRWSPDGATLYFVPPVPPRPFLAASIQTAPRFVRGAVQEVGFAWLGKNFRADPSRATAPYDVMPDGTGFIGVQSGDGEGGEAPAPQIIIVQHWFTELQRLVPTN